MLNSENLQKQLPQIFQTRGCVPDPLVLDPPLDYVQISTLNSISEDLNFSEFKALTSLMIVKFNSQETASAIHFDIDTV